MSGLVSLTGRLYNFLNSAYSHIGHITPVYLWNLERMAEDKFVSRSMPVRFRRRLSGHPLGPVYSANALS